jgi:predicted amidophosphoribosyltransferase
VSIIKLVHAPDGADECWALDRYSELRPLMLAAKYRREQKATATLCGALWAEIDSCVPRTDLLHDVAAIVAVPSRWPLSQRTAGALAARMGISWRRGGLTWLGKPPIALKLLPPDSRRFAVRGAMCATQTSGTVLIVDDSVHSTATFSEASRALRGAGADRIVCVALARI